MSVQIKTSGTRGKNMEALLKGVKRAEGVKGYKLGWPNTATYPDGTEVAKVALWNEFGVPENNLPERPFFRNANSSFNKDLKKNVPKAVDPKLGLITKTGNRLLALLHRGYVQLSIRNLRQPANAPSTVSQKGSTNPLIDTGLLRRSVTHEPLK